MQSQIKYYQLTNCVFIDYPIRRHSQGMYKKVTYIRTRKIQDSKIKHLFIIIKVQLITISSVIPYISETNSTSSSLKKKKNPQERKRKGKRDGKEEKKKKGKERVCTSERVEEKGERKGKMENEMGKKRRKKRR